MIPRPQTEVKPTGGTWISANDYFACTRLSSDEKRELYNAMLVESWLVNGTLKDTTGPTHTCLTRGCAEKLYHKSGRTRLYCARCARKRNNQYRTAKRSKE